MFKARALYSGYRIKAIAALFGVWGSLCLLPMQAGAVSLPSVSSAADCTLQPDFAPAAASPGLQVGMSKSDAILGGTGSALDRIRSQQAGLALPVPASLRVSRESALAVGVLPCSADRLILPSPLSFQEPAAIVTASIEEEDGFLATGRVPIRRTSFSRNWDRVSHDELNESTAYNLIGFDAGEGTERLQRVNRWVNRSIEYGEDRVIWANRDYWASANETIELGQGDCEDIAILKYHLLLALGVEREDLFLTLARDLARNADHAVLIVRENGRFYLLDNAVDAILPANVAYDYRPTLSFNSESAWLHGTGVAQTTAATYLSVNAISSPRVMGFSR